MFKITNYKPIRMDSGSLFDILGDLNLEFVWPARQCQSLAGGDLGFWGLEFEER